MYSLTNNQWNDFVEKIRSNDESLGDSLNLSCMILFTNH